MKEVYQFVESRITDIIRREKPDSILDFGCGDGFFLQILASKFKQSLWGADYCGLSNGEIIEFLNVKIFNLSHPLGLQYFNSSTFDMAYSLFTMHHFEFPHSTLRKLREAMGAGKFVIFSDFLYALDDHAWSASLISNFSEILSSLDGEFHRHYYSVEELYDIFNETGFKIENFEVKIFKKNCKENGGNSITEEVATQKNWKGFELKMKNLITELSQLQKFDKIFFLKVST